MMGWWSKNGSPGTAASTLPSRALLVSCMVISIATVTGLAWWDDQREADAALRDLESQQTVVASTLAASLRAHLATVERAAALPSEGIEAAQLLGTDPGLAPSGELAVLLSVPGHDALYATDGRKVESPPLRAAVDSAIRAVRLDRPQAAQVGLPARTAMAGIALVDEGALGRWGVVAVASAARERDREKRALWRLVLSVLVTSSLVLAFGGVALRNQRRELELSRQLAIAKVQRAADEALAHAQRAATMGTFAMGVAHEVSTPLGVIMGRAEQLIRRIQGDERATNGAQVILKQTDRIQQIVRRFLDMARGGPPCLERTEPSEVALGAARSVQHRFSQASVVLKSDVPASMPAIQCDRALLEQALVNLLLNSCEACRPGEQVDIAARADAETVAFVVTDNGAGIPSEHAARATQPFFTTKAERGGSGLGLAIASEIAKSHRGELTIGPNAPRGTRACIQIPIATPRENHA
jgi:signal transduction histidine kinase